MWINDNFKFEATKLIMKICVISNGNKITGAGSTTVAFYLHF